MKKASSSFVQILHLIQRHKFWFFVALVAALLMVALVAPPEVWAGPGGQFVKVVTKSFWGKVVLGVLAVVFLPLITYVIAREWIEHRRALKALRILAQEFPEFSWDTIEQRVREAATEVYAAWDRGDLKTVAHYLTPSFLESQQDMLDRWAEEGKQNVVELKEISRVVPLLVQVENEDDHSLVAVEISCSLIDFLQDIETGKIIKGKSKPESDFTTIWSFIMMGGEWLLHSIDDGSNSLVMATAPNRIDTSYLRRYAAELSELPAPDLAQDEAATDDEEPAVRVSGDDQ